MSADDTTTDTTTEATDETSAPEPDPLREGALARLTEALGDDLVESHLRPGDDLWIRVTPAAWQRTAEVARDKVGLRYFCFLSAIDWKPSPWGRGEDDPTEPPPERSTEIVQGYAGGDTRLQVFARLSSVTEHYGVTFKVDVPDDDPVVDSWSGVFAGADWHERETWEMFGVSFAGHPNLAHIYLPGAFEGHPLRKDFPLLPRMVKPWPGIADVEPMPAGAAGDAEDDEGGEG